MQGDEKLKWFKHQTGARNDEKIAHLEDRAGLEGYGFYFKMLEIVGEVIDSTDKHEVTYSASRWGRQVNVSTKKFLFLVQCCADVGLMIVQRDADNMTIKIPNLLKYRDNHTKNLQATCKQELEEDKEEEQKESKKEKEPKAPAKAFALPDWIDRSVWDLWMTTRKGRKMIPAQMQAQVTKLERWKDEGLDYALALSNSAEAGWQGLFEPKPKSGKVVSINNDHAREDARARLFGGKNNATA